MSHTIYGQLADALGHAHVAEFARTAAGPRVIHHRFASPSTAYRRTQIPAALTIEHRGQPVGHVVHLELTSDKRLLAVAVTDQDIPDGPWHYSPTVTINENGVIDLNELTITRTPGTLLQPELAIVKHADVTNRYSLPRLLDRTPDRRSRQLLEHAHEQAARGGHEIEVRTADAATPIDVAPGESYPAPYLPKIEIRPGGRILSVS